MEVNIQQASMRSYTANRSQKEPVSPILLHYDVYKLSPKLNLRGSEAMMVIVIPYRLASRERNLKGPGKRDAKKLSNDPKEMEHTKDELCFKH
jgi:hypothetical protein